MGTWEVEEGEPEVHSHPWLHSKFKTNLGYENPVSTDNKDTRFVPWSCDRRMGTRVKGTHRILGSVGSAESVLGVGRGWWWFRLCQALWTAVQTMIGPWVAEKGKTTLQ